MKNECLRLIGNDRPLSQHHKPRHEQNMHIVIETIDGQVVETRLPKEQAQRLFRKIRSAWGNATVVKEGLTPKEETQTPASERW